MPLYRFTTAKGRLLGEVKSMTLERAWEIVAARPGLAWDEKRALQHEIVGFPDQGANDLDVIVAKLTYNGAVTLRRTVEKEEATDRDRLNVFTGTGKWTTLALMGVFYGLRSKGCAEERVNGFNSGVHGPRPYTGYYLTPLGRRVGEHIRDHWAERLGELLP